MRAPAILRLDLLALVALQLLLGATACVLPSPWLSGLSTAVWCLVVALAFRLRTAPVMMLTPVLLIHLSVMVSLVAIESGAFMKEIGLAGTPSAAGALYPIVSLVLVGCALGAYGFWDAQGHSGSPRPPPQHGLALPWWLGCAALFAGLGANLYLLKTGLSLGFPLLTGTDRFAFRASVDMLALNLLNLKVVIAAALATGALAAGSRTLRLSHHGVFGAYLGLSFLFGDKFFNILVASLVYAMPGAVAAPEQFRRTLARRLPAVVAVLGAVLSVTAFIYSDQGRLDLGQTLERLSDRIAGQGQLWWVALRDNGAWLSFDAEAAALNLESLLASPAATFVFEQRLAAFYFVERYAPAALYESFLNNAGTVTPTMLFEAYALVLFGGVGVVLAAVAGGLFSGSVLYWLQSRMRSGNVVDVLLPAFVLIQTFYLLAQGTVYSLLGTGNLKAYAAFLGLQALVWCALRLRQAAGAGALHA